MPTMKFALQKKGPKRLEISWQPKWQDISVRLDGNQIGSFDSFEQLQSGQDFVLDDGTKLRIHIKGNSKFSMPQVLKNGQPLYPSGISPAQQLKTLYKIIFLIGAMNIIGGFMILFGFSARGTSIAPSTAAMPIVSGILFLVLGFFVMRKSSIALAIAIAVFTFGTINACLVPNLSTIAWFLIVLRCVITLGMLTGFSAIRALKQDQLRDLIKLAAGNTLNEGSSL